MAVSMAAGVQEMVPDSNLVETVTRVVAPSSIVAWKRVERGYTPAQRWVAQLDGGASVFVKAAVNEVTTGWLRAEYMIYSQLNSSYLPRMLGWEDDGSKPVLILEDLTHANWPPPWSASLIEGVLETLGNVRTTVPPLQVTHIDSNLLSGWSIVEKDPEPFLGLGICTPEWLHEALPSMLKAERNAPTAGDELVHLDVRSDNMCFINGRMLLVDWNLACRANGLLDVAAWLPSLQLEGGPMPEDVEPEASAFAGLISGYFAARAGQPVIENAPHVRSIQMRQLLTALPWAIRTLGLPPLDGQGI